MYGNNKMSHGFEKEKVKINSFNTIIFSTYFSHKTKKYDNQIVVDNI